MITEIKIGLNKWSIQIIVHNVIFPKSNMFKPYNQVKPVTWIISQHFEFFKVKVGGHISCTCDHSRPIVKAHAWCRRLYRQRLRKKQLPLWLWSFDSRASWYDGTLWYTYFTDTVTRNVKEELYIDRKLIMSYYGKMIDEMWILKLSPHLWSSNILFLPLNDYNHNREQTSAIVLSPSYWHIAFIRINPSWRLNQWIVISVSNVKWNFIFVWIQWYCILWLYRILRRPPYRVQTIWPFLHIYVRYNSSPCHMVWAKADCVACRFDWLIWLTCPLISLTKLLSDLIILIMINLEYTCILWHLILCDICTWVELVYTFVIHA